MNGADVLSSSGLDGRQLKLDRRRMRERGGERRCGDAVARMAELRGRAGDVAEATRIGACFRVDWAGLLDFDQTSKRDLGEVETSSVDKGSKSALCTGRHASQS
jgi:hypothetical protein